MKARSYGTVGQAIEITGPAAEDDAGEPLVASSRQASHSGSHKSGLLGASANLTNGERPPDRAR